jgi:hypothetical protein
MYLAATSRRDNETIVLLLDNSTFNDKVQILEAVAKRDDSHFHSILDYLLNRSVGNTGYRYEYLARIFLEEIGLYTEDSVTVKTVIDNNRAVLVQYMRSFKTFRQPGLKAVLLSVAPLVSRDVAINVLLSEGRFLLDVLERNDGYIDTRFTPEVKAFYESCTTTGENSLFALGHMIHRELRQDHLKRIAKKGLDQMAEALK